MLCTSSRSAAAFLLLGRGGIVAVLAVVILVAVVLAGCGRGSMVGRGVDDFSAYYNTFYNAKRAFDEALQPLEEREDPIDRNVYLSVFLRPTQVQGEEAFARAIEKSADLLRQHPQSRWVDDALLLIGKSYYYQENYVGAERKFREVIAQGGALAGEARFWLGRALLSGGDHVAAEQHLTEALQSGALPTRWAAHVQLLLGDLYARERRWKDAAAALAEGVPGVRDGQTRARALFLRGQVLETMHRYGEAAQSYRGAAEERPRYELAYAAEASALQMAARAGEEGVFRELRRMERDDKNEAKRAELALLRGALHQAQDRYAQARRHFEELLYAEEERGAVNPPAAVQGRVHYALATLYRDVYDDFTRAAAHFDTAATTLPAPTAAVGRGRRAVPLASYAITDSRRQAERYGRVADAARAVARLDSLLRLGMMEEEAFTAFVDSLRRARAEAERTADEQEARRRAEQRFQRGGVQERRDGAVRQSGGGGEAGFLFHRDPAQVQQGLRGFVRRWGQRPRVPNWRRRAAISTRAEAEAPGEPAQTVGPEQELPVAALPSVDVSAVPRSPARQRSVRAERAALRYDLGNALLLAAERPDSAAVWFRRVIEEGADTALVRRARYALAEAERAAGHMQRAREQYRQIVRDLPHTPLARRAQQRLAEGNPRPEASSQNQDAAEQAYAQAYRQWEAGAHERALQSMLEVAARHAEAAAAPQALLAAAHIFAEWARRSGRSLAEPLPVRLPEGLPAALDDSSLTVSTSAVPVRLSLLDTSGLAVGVLADTVLAEEALLQARPRHALTLERLLTGLARQYPQTPHAIRARRMLEGLREQAAAALAARPPARSGSMDTSHTTIPADSTVGRVPAPEGDAAAPRGRRLHVGSSRADSSAGQAEVAAVPVRVEPDEAASWTIIVASVSDRARAEELAERFRQRLGPEVYVIPAALQDELRYHVAVGRFGSRTEGEAARRRHQPALPPDSWLLETSQSRE